MRCADCGLYECAIRTALGGCPNGVNGPLNKGYEPADAMKLLEEKIKLVSEKGTFDGIDVDEYLAEIRGHDTKLYKAASDLVDAVESYMRQECLRSELAMKKEKLKALIHD